MQQQASHLMDLLDISLGAASISGPSQSTDPWGMPVSDGSKVRFTLQIIHYKAFNVGILFLFRRHLIHGDVRHQQQILGNRQIPAQYRDNQCHHRWLVQAMKLGWLELIRHRLRLDHRMKAGCRIMQQLRPTAMEMLHRMLHNQLIHGCQRHCQKLSQIHGRTKHPKQTMPGNRINRLLPIHGHQSAILA